MTFTQFIIVAGVLLLALAVVLWVLLALGRNIDRNDDRLHEDDDLSDYR